MLRIRRESALHLKGSREKTDRGCASNHLLTRMLVRNGQGLKMEKMLSRNSRRGPCRDQDPKV